MTLALPLITGARSFAAQPMRLMLRGFSSEARQWPSVAIIGVGQMGAAVAGNLLRSGVPTTLFDLRGPDSVPEVLRPRLADAKWAKNAAEAAAASRVVITALPRPEHVSAAFEKPGGILEGFQAGTTWIEHSTTDFQNTIRVKGLVEEKGGYAVEAPLTGGMQILREGKMVTLVGADPKVFEGTIADLISLSAPRIVRCGEFGHATIIKIFSNILCAVHDVAMGETLCVAKKAGLDMKLVFDAMRVSSGNSFCWETEVPLTLKGEYDPNFTAEMMAKDLSLGLELGKRYGVPQRINQHVADIYQECIEKYGPMEGSTIPVKLVEDNSGVRLCEGNGSAGDAFKDWSYTTEINDGSYTVVHQDMKNPYTQGAWVKKQ